VAPVLRTAKAVLGGWAELCGALIDVRRRVISRNLKLGGYRQMLGGRV